jgi:hypothetical protein
VIKNKHVVSHPRGIVFDSDNGNLYVTMKRNLKVHVMLDISALQMVLQTIVNLQTL